MTYVQYNSITRSNSAEHKKHDTNQSNKYIQVERYYEKIAEFKGHILKAAVVNLNIEILQSLRILDEQNARQSSFLYTDKNGRTILHDLFDQWSQTDSETNKKIKEIFFFIFMILQKDIGSLLVQHDLFQTTPMHILLKKVF